MKNKILLSLFAICIIFASTSIVEAAPMKKNVPNQIERRHPNQQPPHHFQQHRRELPPPMIPNHRPIPHNEYWGYPDNRVTINIPGLYLSF